MTQDELKERTLEYGLRILNVVKGNLLPIKQLEPLLKETEELIAIFVATDKSSRSNPKSEIRNPKSEMRRKKMNVSAMSFFRRKARARRAVCAFLGVWSVLATLPLPLLALPQGGAVGGGNVSWSTIGNTMTVNQGSHRAIINWNSFGIGAQETVRFLQPGADAAILNRVTGPYSSEIFGSLLANGHVYLINPNGILFGAGARVNVGGLVASTFDISDEDFNAGRLNFARLLNSGGKVVNRGTITADAFAYLLGAGVENSGTVKAPAVALAAGRDRIVIDRTPNGGEIRLSVDAEMPAISFTAFDDPAAMPNVVNEGVVDVSGETGGQAVLQGVNVVQAGTVNADGTQGDGGRISLLGERLVALGGESATTANAGTEGDGGRIEIIAENFAGIYDGAWIAARGGSLRGDGGFVETSGRQSFVIDAVPDVGAANGRGGEWLIDPYDITITDSGNYGYDSSNPALIFSTFDNALLPVSIILGALGSGNVTVQTGTGGGTGAGTITVGAAIVYLGANTLTLDAVQDILINATIQAENGGLGLTAGGYVTQAVGADLRLGTLTLDVGGDVTLGNAGNRIGTLHGTVGGNLSLRNGVSLNLNGLNVADGLTTLDITGSLTDAGANSIGDLTVTATGAITLDHTGNDFGLVTATAGGAIALTDKNGLILRDIDGGSLTVSARDGSIGQEDGTTVDVAGATALDATGQIVLFNEGNLFGGPVDAAATLVKLRDADGIELGVVDVGAGGLTVQTDGGAVTQTGTGHVSVEGETHLTARSGGAPAGIALANDANDFVGAVHADGADIALTDGNGIVLGDVVAAGTLAVTARSGSITQTGGTRVDATGAATLLAEGVGNDIALENAANDFRAAVNADGRNIALADANAILLGEVAADGTLDVTALGGDIAQTGDGITAQGATTLTATGDITLDNALNDFIDGPVNADGANIALVDANAILLGLVLADGTLDVTALGNGDITQTASGGVTATGEATLTAEGDAITLASENNDFQGTVNAYGNDVTLTDGAGDLMIGRIKGKAAPADTAAANTVILTALDGDILDAQNDTVGHDAEGFATQTGDARVANILAENLLLDAAGNIGSGGNPLDLTVGTLAARSANGSIWLYETDALTIGTVNGVAGIVAAADVKVETAGGSLTVDQAVGATSGDILLAANGAGANVAIHAAVTATAGDLTVLAANGVTQNADGDLTAGATIDVEAKAASIAMTDGASATAGGNIRYLAAQNAAVTGLNGANVRVEATAGSITDAGDTLADVTANAAQLVAGGSVGGAGGTESDDNAQAIDTAVETLAAQAGTGSIYVNEGNALRIGSVAAIGVNRVALDSTATPVAGAALAGAAAAQNVKIAADLGTLGVDAAVTATAGDVLLLARDGAVEAGAAVSAGGLASVIGRNGVNLDAGIAAGGDVLIDAGVGGLSSGSGYSIGGASIRLISGGDIALDRLTADDAVSVVAGGDITDANADETANITAQRARLEAGGSIGAGAGIASDANLAAVDLAVANVEASAAANLYLQSLNAVEIGGVDDIGIAYARFDSGTTVHTDADLTGLSAVSGVVKFKGAGAVTLSEAVDAGTDALLLTTAGDITLGAALNAGNLATVIAAGGVAQNADIAADGDITVEARNGDIDMAAGTAAESTGGNIRYAASGGVALGSLSGSAVSVHADTGDITDANADETANITAQRARLEAGGSIGAGAGTASDANLAAVDLAVANVEASAAANLYLQSLNAVEIGGVDDIGIAYARFDSGTTVHTDADLTGLSAVSGVVKFKGAGAVTLSEAVDAGTDALLLTTAGDITLGAALNAGNLATVIAAGGVAQNADIAAGGDIDVEAQGESIAVADGAGTTTSGNIFYLAAQDITVTGLHGANVRVEAGRDILDGGDTAVDVTGDASIQLVAGRDIGKANGDADDDNEQAIDISWTPLAAQAGADGSIYVESEEFINIADVGAFTVNRAMFDSGTIPFIVSALSGAVAGRNVKFKSGENMGVYADITATDGDILLLADTGRVALENVTLTAGGRATIIGGNRVDLFGSTVSAGGDVYIDAGLGDIGWTYGFPYAIEGANVRLAGYDVYLDGVTADNAVSVVATHDIIDGNGTAVNITAQKARLEAGGSIGSGTGTQSDVNDAAIDLAVNNVEAKADTGSVYLESANAVTVGGVGDITTSYARFDSGVSTTTDANLDGVLAAQNAKLKSAGSVTVAEIFEATDYDVLLLTTAGGITLNADITAGLHATVIAAGGIAQNADITSTRGGDIYVEVLNGSIIMADGTGSEGGNIRYAASGGVALGSLTAADAVSVVAGGDITDANADETANITAQRARLKAGGSVGSGGGTESDGNSAAIDLAVANVEASVAVNLYLQSLNAVEVGGAGDVVASYARFDSGATAVTDDDLTGLSTGTGAAKLKSAGAVTVTETIGAGTDALLLTTAGDIVLGAALNAGDLATVIAAANVNQNADIAAGGDVYIEAQGGDVAMQAETATGTTGGNIRYAASGGVALSRLDASSGAVSVYAGGDITDANADETANITAQRARLEAGGSIGSAADVANTAIDIEAGNVEAAAAGDIHIRSQNSILIGGAGDVVTSRARFDSGSSTATDADLPGVTAGGDFTATAVGGSIAQAPDSSVTVQGDSVLTAHGDIALGNGGNDFMGRVDADGVNIVLTDKNDLLLGEVAADGDFAANALDGSITQTPDGRVTVQGVTTLDASEGITLLNGANDFIGKVNAEGVNVSLRDNNGIVLGLVLAGGDLFVEALNGDVAQTYGPDRVEVEGDAELLAPNGDVDLENPRNDFRGRVDATARNAAIRDSDDLLVGRIEATAGGHVRLTAGGSIAGGGAPVNVVAGSAELYAGADIGAPLYLDVGIIDEARAGGNIRLVEVSGDMWIGRQIYAGGNVTLTVPGGGIYDADGDGYVRPKYVNADNADIYAGRTMFLDAHRIGTLDEPVELISRGPLHLDSHLADAGGMGAYVWAVINGSVGRGARDIVLDGNVPGMVIYNGQLVTGPWWVVRQFQLAQRSLFNRDQANLLDTGIAKVPWFLHPDMSLLSRGAVRDDLRPPEEKRVDGAEEAVPGDEPRTVVIGIPVTMVD
jgi:filamentous hemagglutinin family protein